MANKTGTNGPVKQEPGYESLNQESISIDRDRLVKEDPSWPGIALVKKVKPKKSANVIYPWLLVAALSLSLAIVVLTRPSVTKPEQVTSLVREAARVPEKKEAINPWAGRDSVAWLREEIKSKNLSPSELVHKDLNNIKGLFKYEKDHNSSSLAYSYPKDWSQRLESIRTIIENFTEIIVSNAPQEDLNNLARESKTLELYSLAYASHLASDRLFNGAILKLAFEVNASPDARKILQEELLKTVSQFGDFPWLEPYEIEELTARSLPKILLIAQP